MKLKAWVLAMALAAVALPLAKTAQPAGKSSAALSDSKRPISTWFDGNMPVPPGQFRS